MASSSKALLQLIDKSIKQGQTLKGLVSSCLVGRPINYKGADHLNNSVFDLYKNSKIIQWVEFCPEDSVFSTPREPMNLFNGSGESVLGGQGKVLTHSGQDVTEKMLQASHNTLKFAIDNQVDFALLKEGSPSCGSNWVYKGESWPNKEGISGHGVTTALLEKNNIPVISENFEEFFQRLSSNAPL